MTVNCSVYSNFKKNAVITAVGLKHLLLLFSLNFLTVWTMMDVSRFPYLLNGISLDQKIPWEDTIFVMIYRQSLDKSGAKLKQRWRSFPLSSQAQVTPSLNFSGEEGYFEMKGVGYGIASNIQQEEPNCKKTFLPRSFITYCKLYNHRKFEDLW